MRRGEVPLDIEGLGGLGGCMYMALGILMEFWRHPLRREIEATSYSINGIAECDVGSTALSGVVEREREGGREGGEGEGAKRGSDLPDWATGFAVIPPIVHFLLLTSNSPPPPPPPPCPSPASSEPPLNPPVLLLPVCRPCIVLLRTRPEEKFSLFLSPSATSTPHRLASTWPSDPPPSLPLAEAACCQPTPSSTLLRLPHPASLALSTRVSTAGHLHLRLRDLFSRGIVVNQ